MTQIDPKQEMILLKKFIIKIAKEDSNENSVWTPELLVALMNSFSVRISSFQTEMTFSDFTKKEKETLKKWEAIYREVEKFLLNVYSNEYLFEIGFPIIKDKQLIGKYKKQKSSK